MAVAMARSSTAAALAAIVVVSVLSPALSVPLNATASDRLSEDFHAISCPHVAGVVRNAMIQALQSDINLAAGLLRIFFHDAFPQGADASILLGGPFSEQAMGPNLTLQKQALLLIEQIRRQLHAICGPVVSCADILAVATRDAVFLTGGPFYGVPLGRFDSLAPAPQQLVNILPSPTSQASELLNAFASRGFGHPVELVALSGAHSIGRTHCNFFSDRASRREDFFALELLNVCSRNPNWVQNLDVHTPNRFDNQYYRNLLNQQGVFTSDMALVRDFRTAPIVQHFAQNPPAFFTAFTQAMLKLSTFRPDGNVGEIRQFSCFRTNSGRLSEAASDEGLAASA